MQAAALRARLSCPTEKGFAGLCQSPSSSSPSCTSGVATETGSRLTIGRLRSGRALPAAMAECEKKKMRAGNGAWEAGASRPATLQGRRMQLSGAAASSARIKAPGSGRRVLPGPPSPGIRMTKQSRVRPDQAGECPRCPMDQGGPCRRTLTIRAACWRGIAGTLAGLVPRRSIRCSASERHQLRVSGSGGTLKRRTFPRCARTTSRAFAACCASRARFSCR